MTHSWSQFEFVFKHSMKDYETELDTEIEKRIAEMENPDYKFAKRLGKRDYIIIVIFVTIGIVCIIAGAYLH